MNKQRSPSQKRTLSKDTNYYEILGVAQDASADDIKKRYKVLVLKFHPDKEKSSLAREAMVSINNAYDVLSDSQKRLVYDTILQNSKERSVDEISGTRWKRPDLTKLVIWKKRILPLIVFIVVFSIAYEAGSQTELSDDSARTVSVQFMKNTETYYDIISHDAVLAFHFSYLCLA